MCPPPSLSLMGKGMMEFLTSNHAIARDLRRKVAFKIIPMLNPDGVLLGNTRCNVLGADMNRSWGDISPFHQPILHAVNRLIMDCSKVRSILW